jgi:hypothetical protein
MDARLDERLPGNTEFHLGGDDLRSSELPQRDRTIVLSVFQDELTHIYRSVEIAPSRPVKLFEGVVTAIVEKP